jgi:hypothetical protein
MRSRLGRTPFVIAALAPASLVLVHNLTFLAAYGSQFQAVLRATGHDGRWTATVMVVVVVSALLAGVGLARLGWLWLQARSLERVHGHRPKTDFPGYLRILARLWPWLAFVTAVLFVGQENLEQASLGEPLPGLEPLLSGSSLPPFVILTAVTFVLAALGALLRWGHATLTARIAAALRTRRPAPAALALRQPAMPTRTPSSIMSRNLGRRAPPPILFS